MISRNLFFIGTLCVSSLLAAQVKDITTVAEYEKIFKTEPMITLYFSNNCGPCKATKPHFHKAAEEHTNINFCMIDTTNSKLQNHINKLNIQAIPTLIGSCNGSIILHHTGGLTKNELERKIAEFKESIAKAKKKPAPRAGKKATPAQKKKPAA